jgi:CRP-like cAMP-binding protein
MGEAQYRGLMHTTRNLDLFKGLNGAQVDKLCSHIQLCVFDKGEAIFKKGDQPHGLYIIYGGRVRIFLGYRFYGLMKRFANLKGGDLFGEMALIENRPHSATAVASGTTQLFVILRDDFDAMMRHDPEFADLMKYVVSRRRLETAH